MPQTCNSRKHDGSVEKALWSRVKKSMRTEKKSRSSAQSNDDKYDDRRSGDLRKGKGNCFFKDYATHPLIHGIGGAGRN